MGEVVYNSNYKNALESYIFIRELIVIHRPSFVCTGMRNDVKAISCNNIRKPVIIKYVSLDISYNYVSLN